MGRNIFRGFISFYFLLGRPFFNRLTPFKIKAVLFSCKLQALCVVIWHLVSEIQKTYNAISFAFSESEQKGRLRFWFGHVIIIGIWHVMFNFWKYPVLEGYSKETSWVCLKMPLVRKLFVTDLSYISFVNTVSFFLRKKLIYILSLTVLWLTWLSLFCD